MERAIPLSRLLLASCVALAAGCGPQPLEVKASFTVGQNDTRAALKAQMPPALLASVGGALPEAWPATAPRLLVDLLVLSRSRVELTAGGVDRSKFAALRLRSVQSTTSGPLGLILPQPSELLLFAGPAGAASLSDPGVRRLARGAFPSATTITCLACPRDAGSGGSLQQQLALEPGARGGLQDLILGNASFELLLAIRVPVDSAADPLAPRGAASVQVQLDLELAP